MLTADIILAGYPPDHASDAEGVIEGTERGQCRGCQKD
jgi:hypothetical protein